MRVGVGVSVLLVCDFDCWKSRIKLLCRNLLSVRRIIGPVQHLNFFLKLRKTKKRLKRRIS